MTFEYINKGFDVLSISFAGFYDDNPRFDWNILNKFDTDLLLIKDVKMAWYLCGVDGISSDVSETVEFIHQYTNKYKKLLFFGSSMGGYAALLYGSLVSHGDKTINSFGPQVNISPSAEIVNKWTVKAVDENVEPYIKDCDRRFLSLGDAGLSVPEKTFIHYGNGHMCDPYHAGLIDCNQVPYECDLHGIATWMYDNGLLVPYLRNLYKN
jgi:hypothetical protein